VIARAEPNGTEPSRLLPVMDEPGLSVAADDPLAGGAPGGGSGPPLVAAEPVDGPVVAGGGGSGGGAADATIPHTSQYPSTIVPVQNGWLHFIASAPSRAGR
jgi:hypothetical protein